MLITIFRTTAAIGAMLLTVGPASAHSLDAMLKDLDPATLGEVNFATSCTAEGHEAFEIGLLLLHHMMYRQSAAAFQAAAEADPNCAMAQWGIAMTKFHPLWPGGPTPEETEAGQAAAAQLAQMDPGTAREAAYVDAVQAFYAGEDLSFRERLAAWASEQRELAAAYPDDLDAAAFDALAQLTMAPLGPDAVPVLRDAGERMDALRTRAPRHPGGYHYAIHAYDHPALAETGLEVARDYDSIAPEVPHALHMPSHIFTRLGLWEESAEWNARSAAAVLSQAGDGILADHYPHAIDYAIYAHLQAGDVSAAQALLDELADHTDIEDTFGSAYASSAAPARILLETGDWAAAAALPTEMSPAITWARYPQAVAMRWFAVGIGAARSGDSDAARAALAELHRLLDTMADRDMRYWIALTEAQIASIGAWVALNEGDTSQARALMTDAVEMEDAVGKSPVTPGHVLPARELLGDLLLELGDNDSAAQAYEASLQVSPNRARSLSGLEAASDG
jgi:tetratricopeptide (TPR) repeat protein